jgi:SlyX protein
MSDPKDEKIVDLEIRLAHQEAEILEITKSLVAQDNAMRKMRLEIEQLKSQLLAIGRNELAAPADEPPPPHY